MRYLAKHKVVIFLGHPVNKTAKVGSFDGLFLNWFLMAQVVRWLDGCSGCDFGNKSYLLSALLNNRGEI